jgi:hypothetical protein
MHGSCWGCVCFARGRALATEGQGGILSLTHSPTQHHLIRQVVCKPCFVVAFATPTPTPALLTRMHTSPCMQECPPGYCSCPSLPPGAAIHTDHAAPGLRPSISRVPLHRPPYHSRRRAAQQVRCESWTTIWVACPSFRGPRRWAAAEWVPFTSSWHWAGTCSTSSNGCHAPPPPRQWELPWEQQQ